MIKRADAPVAVDLTKMRRIVRWEEEGALPCWSIDAAGRLIYDPTPLPRGYSASARWVLSADESNIHLPWQITRQELDGRIQEFFSLCPSGGKSLVRDAYPNGTITHRCALWFPPPPSDLYPKEKAMAIIHLLDKSLPGDVDEEEVLQRLSEKGVYRIPAPATEPVSPYHKNASNSPDAAGCRVIQDGWMRGGQVIRPCLLE
jgi:hypothetical protein